MRIKITTAFTDLQAKDPADADVPAGKEMTVTAERGAELVELGLAEPIDGTAADTTTAKK
ncbi:MAG: hypothetical protein GY736_06440 [Sphingomonas sp.]|uniref:hypothetical protein n=1 Tax=Sphingomonas sp. TaxID=28214 RepID=UPI0025870D86|nr:hypothetical protein [Sphingomonas sp.]MCP4025932.1 hypothetical protein [Sphingomonas sp.]